jgi:hypothetical protein
MRRTSLGTIPSVSIAAAWKGIEGGIAGIIRSSILFGLGALATSFLGPNGSPTSLERNRLRRGSRFEDHWMFNLNDIVQGSQGGQGVNNLARQFGLTPEQTQAAIQALIPSLSAGLQRQAASLEGLGGLLRALAQGLHQRSYSDPQALAEAGGAANQALAQMFGNGQVFQQVLQNAAAASGASAATLQQMMPAMLSMIFGGMSQSMANQGLGTAFNQLAAAANSQGGLASLWGKPPSAAASVQPPSAPPAQAAIVNPFGPLLANLFGTGPLPQTSAPAPPPPADPQTQALQAGLEALAKMMQPGIEIAQQQQKAMQDLFNQMLGPTGSGTAKRDA